jgi:predicted  nucleic acid-binding Zn-ribbon protein
MEVDVGAGDGSSEDSRIKIEGEEVARIQRELAALWLQDGQLWQNTASEAFLPGWSLDELGVSPTAEDDPAIACLDAYLAKFGGKIDDINWLSVASPAASCGEPHELLSNLPEAYLGDPSSFDLVEEANWEFALAFGGAGGTGLQALVDAIDEALFREALKKRKEFDACQSVFEDLKNAVGGLTARIRTERAEVQGIFQDLCAGSHAPVLKRRRNNLGRVINDLERINDAFEAIEDIRTVLDDENATEAETEEVMVAYRSVREQVEDMVGRIRVIDELLSSLVERHDSRVAQLILDEYRERLESLKASLSAETWRHTADIAKLQHIADIIGGTVCEDAMKVNIGGRAYGFVKSVTPLADVVAYLRELATEKARGAREAAPLALDVFRVFNDMTRQLVLGAGAIESAGMQSISVKNLAVAREQIELASYIASHLVKDALPVEFEHDIDLCVSEIDAHAEEIRAKIVSVAVALILPLIKNAATALGSQNLLTTTDEADGLIPYFKDLVDGMLRNLRIIAKVTRASFLDQDAEALLEEICAHLVTWLRDAGSRVSTLAQVENFRRHAGYLREQFSTVHVSLSIDEVLKQFEERQHDVSS